MAVYDHVISRDVALEINNYQDTSKSQYETVGHRIFSLNQEPITPTEMLLKSLGTELEYSDSTTLEYWWRDEWINMELHRDVDEVLAKQEPEKEFLFPEKGHVLYLDIGQGVEGPTVVFTDPNHKGAPFDFGVCPAVPGRLLIFEGNLRHAVPRPGLSYLNPSEGGTNCELWSPKVRDEHERTDMRRSVLLFNAWRAPPTDAYRAAGHSTDATDVTAITAQPRTFWVRQAFMDYRRPAHNVALWGLRLKLGLLGDKKRREGIGQRFVDVYSGADGDEMRSALKAQATPSYFNAI